MSWDHCQNIIFEFNLRSTLEAGMHGDNASGNSLNLVIIEPNETVFKGPIVPEFCKRPEPNDLVYKFQPGATIDFLII
ncbi:unnamed protein product [Caenorhabditis sp. 36 PRJEB53466]|nr:unnamed protein product [Caenorhabditis sp. 36 PRJEB53466]